MKKIEWRDADNPNRKSLPAANLLGPVDHWIYPLKDRAVVHLRHLPGMHDGYGACGPWEATWERHDGTVQLLVRDIRICVVQAIAEDVIGAACGDEQGSQVAVGAGGP